MATVQDAKRKDLRSPLLDVAQVRARLEFENAAAHEAVRKQYEEKLAEARLRLQPKTKRSVPLRAKDLRNNVL